jgi:hypothetical protein
MNLNDIQTQTILKYVQRHQRHAQKAEEAKAHLNEVCVLLAGDGGHLTMEDGQPVLMTKEEVEYGRFGADITREVD